MFTPFLSLAVAGRMLCLNVYQGRCALPSLRGGMRRHSGLHGVGIAWDSPLERPDERSP